jgi:hypothetical protein
MLLFLTLVSEMLLLHVILCGCETWSLTIKEEHGLRIFKNRVLRSIFGPKREMLRGGRRRLYAEELHNLYSSQTVLGQRTR